MQFGCTLRSRFTRHCEVFVNIVRVAAFLIVLHEKAAELAIGVAEIRRIQMAIDIEVRVQAVLATTDDVGEATYAVQII